MPLINRHDFCVLLGRIYVHLILAFSSLLHIADTHFDFRAVFEQRRKL